MRPSFFIYLFMPLACFSSSKSCKDFKKYNNPSTNKAHILIKEEFQDYSVGSTNWHQSPLEAFKKFIDGSFLDHLFLKNTQKNSHTLFFDSSISESLNQSIADLEISSYNQDIHEKPHDPEKFKSDPCKLTLNAPLSFNLLRNEITKAISHLNFAITQSPAKAFNNQIITAKPQNFSDLFIGSPFWQKDVLGSFSSLESLQNLEHIFTNQKNTVHYDVFLLSAPLKQTLLDNSFFQSFKTPDFNENCIKKIQTHIKDTSKETANVKKTLITNFNTTDFINLVQLNATIASWNIASAQQILSNKHFITNEEPFKKDTFDPSVCLQLPNNNVADNPFTKIQDPTINESNQSNQLLSILNLKTQPSTNPQKPKINTESVDYKRYEHIPETFSYISPTNNELSSYAKHFCAMDQSSTLVIHSQRPAKYRLSLNHPQAYTSTSYLLPSIYSTTFQNNTIEEIFLSNELLESDFCLSDHEILSSHYPIDSDLSYHSADFPCQKEFKPQTFCKTFSYNYNYHYNEATASFSKPLFLCDLAEEKILLNHMNYNYKFKSHDVLDTLFQNVFEDETSISSLPLIDYEDIPSSDPSGQPLVQVSSPLESPYFEQENDFTDMQHIDCSEYSFDLGNQDITYQKMLEYNCQLHQALNEDNALVTINALNKINSNKDLFKLLENDPSNKSICLNTMFESKVQVIANMKEDNYLFRIKMDSQIKKSPLRHTIYFVLDHTKDMKKSELYAYKTLISKSLVKLKKQKTFFNIITIGSDVHKLHDKNLKPTKSSLHLANQFLKNLSFSKQDSGQRVFDVIRKIKYDSHSKNEMSTVILLSSLKPFSQFSKFRIPIQKIAKIESNNFQLFGFHYGYKSAASGINLLAKLNRGYLLNSNDVNTLYKKGTTLMTKIRRPFITDIRLTLADSSSENVQFAYSSDYNPILCTQKPFFIYGSINTLDNVKFILQGKQGNEWVNIVQTIDFKEAEIAKGCLEKRVALEKSLYWYGRYFQESQPRFLKIAKDVQKPFDIPLP